MRWTVRCWARTVGGPPHRENVTGLRHLRHQFLSGTIIFPLALAGCAPRPQAAGAARAPSTQPLPRTRAERSGHTETSTHADVVAFLDSLRATAGPMRLGSIGTTVEGRSIPYVIASRPLFDSPDSARRSGRPIVYVQGNIHGGEVEGKEALQALLRDLLAQPAPNVLDSIVLIAVPIYNADGNDRLDRQARNRGAQNGPEMVGQRPNAQGLDLNRDYIKADAPETRASLAMFAAWDPHVFVDLHTTNGSYHGYALTYAPSLNPAAELEGATAGGAYARDSLLPELQRRVLARHQVTTFPYGNFSQPDGASGAPRAWLTYDHRPRFGTNYYALRGRISVLSEAYSHDPFERRVKATYAFTRELLSLVAERRDAVRSLARAADAAVSQWTPGGRSVPVRAIMTETPAQADVIYEVLEQTTDTTTREPGVRRGVRRTGKFVTARMPVADRFTPSLLRATPFGYAVSAADTSALLTLGLHGIRMFRTTRDWTGTGAEAFMADSTIIAPRLFQNRREVRVEGRWISRPTTSLPSGTIIVPVAQPLGVLAMYLLEPESDDGIVTWDIGGRSASPPPLSVMRLNADPQVAMQPWTAPSR
jgi:hypothetical protein